MISRSPSLKSFQFRLSNTKVAVLFLSGVLSFGAYYKVSTDEGIRRALRFNLIAMPPLIKYRYYDWKTKDWAPEKRDELFKGLHRMYAPVVVSTIMELKGFYIKLGQLMGGLDGQLPDEYISVLKVFQNDCPVRDVKEVIKTIEEDLGKPFDQVFLSIDSKPIGSASIGQVHRAKLLNGQDVCVKVQHPDAERFFKVDLATTRFFTSLAQPEQLPVFDEIERSFKYEFDYVLEAENLTEMREALNGDPVFKRNIVIPEPLIATTKVLVMTFLQGETLQAKQKRFLLAIAEKERKTVAQVEAELKKKAKEQLASPPSPNLLLAYRMALRSRDYVKNSFSLGYNILFGYISGSPMAYEWSELPMKATESLDLLFGFFGYSLFHFGKFSSDPHGGNVMHLEGEKLGLIDMGQVKRIDLDTRLKLARLVVALAHDKSKPEDDKRIAKLWRDCGFATKKSNDEVTADLARFNFDRFSSDVVDKYGGIHVMMEEMEKRDPLVKMPDDFIMAMRCSVMIRMNAMGLGQGSEDSKHARVAPIWEKYALELLNSHGEDSSKLLSP